MVFQVGRVDRMSRQHVQLSFLTPHFQEPIASVHGATWTQVDEALGVRDSSRITETTDYLVSEFQELLRGLGLVVQKVNTELVTGLTEANKMHILIREAVREFGMDMGHSQGVAYLGTYLGTGSEYFVGVDFLASSELYFSIRPEDAPLAIKNQWPRPRPEGWHRTSIDLTSDTVGFFDRSGESQRQFILDFIRDSVEEVESAQGRTTPATQATVPQPPS